VSSAPADGVVDQLGSGNGAGPDTPGETSPLAIGSASRRPEVAVGAAFMGGFLLALLLRRVRS
jgi:hypothetical protein